MERGACASQKVENAARAVGSAGGQEAAHSANYQVFLSSIFS
jgi:hypothetical protein